MQPETDPDIAWVARLAGCGERDASRAVREAGGETALFRHLAREHAAAGRDSYVEIDAPLELFALARLVRPRHVIEIGVSSGVSSAYLLRALDVNREGTLHSIDLPSYPRPRRGSLREPRASWSLPPGRSAGWAVPFPLRRRWDLRLGDKADVLPLLAEDLPRIDVLLYDVPHRETDILRELRMLGRRLGPGAVVIIDHGPGGEMCGALRQWAKAMRARPSGRTGLGLYGARRPGTPTAATSAGSRSARGSQHRSGGGRRAASRGPTPD